jgi:hypothetical protein
MWTYTWLSFLPNIFTNLPLVHTPNPDFLGLQLWLCFSPGSWMYSHKTPEPGLQQIPEVTLASQPVRACPCAWVPNRVFIRFPNQQFFRSSDYQQLRFRAPACLWLLLLAESRSPNSAHSRIRDFAGPRFSRIANSLLLKNILWKLC